MPRKESKKARRAQLYRSYRRYKERRRLLFQRCPECGHELSVKVRKRKRIPWIVFKCGRCGYFFCYPIPNEYKELPYKRVDYFAVVMDVRHLISQLIEQKSNSDQEDNPEYVIYTHYALHPQWKIRIHNTGKIDFLFTPR
ncbi:MAG: hypothetical protein DRP01_00565 [Archaeoglobales archaeon]|nr:MAG: hypothetical protein DRP01_00565 [Archaeoglobales archaeon]